MLSLFNKVITTDDLRLTSNFRGLVEKQLTHTHTVVILIFFTLQQLRGQSTSLDTGYIKLTRWIIYLNCVYANTQMARSVFTLTWIDMDGQTIKLSHNLIHKDNWVMMYLWTLPHLSCVSFPRINLSKASTVGLVTSDPSELLNSCSYLLTLDFPLDLPWHTLKLRISDVHYHHQQMSN